MKNTQGLRAFVIGQKGVNTWVYPEVSKLVADYNTHNNYRVYEEIHVCMCNMCKCMDS